MLIRLLRVLVGAVGIAYGILAVLLLLVVLTPLVLIGFTFVSLEDESLNYFSDPRVKKPP